MISSTEKVHANLRIAFQTNKPKDGANGRRRYRELAGTARKVYFSDARLIDAAVKAIQEAIDAAVKKLQQNEEHELP